MIHLMLLEVPQTSKEALFEGLYVLQELFTQN